MLIANVLRFDVRSVNMDCNPPWWHPEGWLSLRELSMSSSRVIWLTTSAINHQTYRGVEHLVYASSSSVYGGNKKVPFSTDDRVDNPVSLYAATKGRTRGTGTSIHAFMCLKKMCIDEGISFAG
jgi:hypothetical protein